LRVHEEKPFSCGLTHVIIPTVYSNFFPQNFLLSLTISSSAYNYYYFLYNPFIQFLFFKIFVSDEDNLKYNFKNLFNYTFSITIFNNNLS